MSKAAVDLKSEKEIKELALKIKMAKAPKASTWSRTARTVK